MDQLRVAKLVAACLADRSMLAKFQGYLLSCLVILYSCPLLQLSVISLLEQYYLPRCDNHVLLFLDFCLVWFCYTIMTQINAGQFN